MNFCGSTGNRNSLLAFIGEAPGRMELLANPPQPFVGPSGKLHWTLLQRQNIYRSDCYCTNVIKQSAPSNPLRMLPEKQLMQWRDSLRRELLNTQCNLYVALGNTALWAIASDEIAASLVALDSKERTGISDWRGSILTTFHGKKLIPTLHPAAILRAPETCYLYERDIALIGQEYNFPEIQLPTSQYSTFPTVVAALAYIQKCQEVGEFAFDIETAQSIVTCISLSYLPGHAMSIPMQGVRYWSAENYMLIVVALQKLLADPKCLKIGQNISYDIIGLRACGIEVKPPIYDIMHMYHAIDPGVVNLDRSNRTVSHSLASQASRFTRHPFWKAWDVVPDNYGHSTNLFEYNCKDSDVTLELKRLYSTFPKETQELYAAHYQRVQPKLIQLYEDGLCVDKALQKQLADSYYEEASALEERICHALQAPKANLNSSTQLAHLLYEVLQLPKQFNRRGAERVITTDDNALINLYLETQIPFILQIRDVKEKLKLASFMMPKSREAQNKRKSWDGRLRCEYKMATGTGRLSSSGSLATGIGINMQNIPSAVRRTIIPAPGHIFLEPDYMQAEARVIAFDSLDYKYMQLFSSPDAFDMHWYNAEIILEKPRAQLQDIDRDACKHVVFGSFYDMKARKLQETVLKYTDPPYFISLQECQKRQDRFASSVPTFRERQERIRKEVLTTGKQISPTGQIVTYHEVITDQDLIYCFGRRDYSEVLRSAYSMIPQNVVSRMINAALVSIDNELRQSHVGRVAAQVHDSLLLEVKDSEDALLVAFFTAQYHMEQPFVIRGNAMTIPTDFKLGYHWQGQEKKIRTPEQLVAAYRRIKR